jgi:hypothetical protein
VRWVAVADEETALAERHAQHRGAHEGHLPPGNEGRVRSAIRLVTRVAA